MNLSMMDGETKIFDRDFTKATRLGEFPVADLRALDGIRGREAYALSTQTLVALEKQPDRRDQIDPDVLDGLFAVRDMSERYGEARWSAK